MYDWLKFIHIVAAMAWVGGSIMVGVFATQVGKAKDSQRMRAFAQDMLVGSRVLMVSGIVVFIAGAWMVVDQALWEWEQTFIALGVVAVVVGAVLGAAFFAPQTEKLIEEIDAGNEGAAANRMKRIGMVSQLELLLLLVVVFAMSAKWGI